jgi:hypothetical protein
MTEIQMTKTKKITTYRIAFVFNFENLDFDIVSDFGFRASDFGFKVFPFLIYWQCSKGFYSLANKFHFQQSQEKH